MLRHQFFADEKVRRCSFPARLLFAGLWCFADNHGLMEYRPAQIKASVFPFDPGLDREPPPDLPALVGELEQQGLVRRYAHEGNDYLCIPNFSKHQKLRRLGESRYPAPLVEGPTRAFHDVTGNSRQMRDTPDDSTPLPSTPINSGTLHNAGVEGEGEKKIEGKGGDSGGRGAAPDIKEVDLRSQSSGAGAQTPEGLSQLEYARRLLESLGLPVSGNIHVVADSIMALSKSTGVPLSIAFERIHAAAHADRDNGTAVNYFWFVDAVYLRAGQRGAKSKADENRAAAEQYKRRIAGKLNR